MARPTVVVTRPEPDASEWAQQLQLAGWPATVLPLLEIGLPDRPEHVQRLAYCRAQWPTYDAVMFVSPQAVRCFLGGMEPRSGLATTTAQIPPIHAHSARCWAPGPGTARALLEQGIAPAQIDSPHPEAGQFDSEALWRVVGPWLAQRCAERRTVLSRGGAPCRVLLVRGDSTDHASGEAGAGSGGGTGTGREWLSDQCRATGAEVEFCVAYERRPAVWSAEQTAQARDAVGKGIWLLSSSEGLPLLRQRLPGVPWAVANALVTHPRIAESARVLGFGHVNIVRPALADVLRGLESSCEPTD